MSDFFLGAAALIVAITAIGLFRVLSGPARADRMMAAQLLGTGGVAALLLAEARGTRGAADVAMVLALLAAFSGIAFVKAVNDARRRDDDAEGFADDARD
ncbi:monovalent cation/H+ antiporter complex subunit F [Methylocystis sp. JAN1]|uniref:monovalent cation/H+ antiporter complex subunit F n=1 Tax=Methylocystis sp. JAN1 TaxID=3397211 RepID=UPI003FA1F161